MSEKCFKCHSPLTDPEGPHPCRLGMASFCGCCLPASDVVRPVPYYGSEDNYTKVKGVFPCLFAYTGERQEERT